MFIYLFINFFGVASYLDTCRCILGSKMDVHIYLPYSNNSISNKDEKDDKWLNKGSDSFLAFLKPGQYLMNRESVRDTSKIHMGGKRKCNICNPFH